MSTHLAMTTVTALPAPTAEHPVLALLRVGVPLSLLLDLASPHGPDSQEIAAVEHARSGPS